MGMPTGHTVLPIPNGWFAVALSSELVKGTVKRAFYFNRELVIFRTREGRLHVLDAYCPHLGAHLAEGGRVVGETVRCPFHAWQYDGTGRCVHIPYSKKDPPKKAVVFSWPVIERNGFVFVWHHDERAAPSWDIPELPELHDEKWTEVRSTSLTVPTHIQDMAENNCDPVHFRYVHGNLALGSSEIVAGEDAHYFKALSRTTQETPLGSFETELERETWGLGLVAVRVKGIGDAGLMMLAATSPIDHATTQSRWSYTVTTDMADLAGEDFIAGLGAGVQQDMQIWKNKIHRATPVLCEADTELAFFRKWVRQFYPKSGNGAAAVATTGEAARA